MSGQRPAGSVDFQVRMAPDGLPFPAPAGQPLLQSAARAGVEMPSSCRNGTCRACISRLLDGRVSYRIEWPGLLPEEKAEGFILPCVAYPETDLLLSFR